MRSDFNKVIRHRLFGEDEISDLAQLFDRDLETRLVNVKCIFRTDGEVVGKYLHHFIEKQVKYASTLINQEWKLNDIFLLEYHPGGFSHLHIDDHSLNGGISLVTVVEQQDLVGGEVIIREADLYQATNDEKDYLISLDVGETIVYSAAIIHGVTRVESGFRRVLVTFLDPKENL